MFYLFLSLHVVSCSQGTKKSQLLSTVALAQLKVNEQILFQHLEVISSDKFAGRKIGTHGNLKAQNYIIKTLKELEIRPLLTTYQQPFDHSILFNPIKYGNNIIAVIDGLKYPDQYIILTAHFDHLGQKGGKIYNGADDNASGTAALLAIAQMISFKPTDYSIVFLFTDGEEADLSGAKAFTETFPKILAKTKLNINIDMIAGANSGKKTKTLHYISYKLGSVLLLDQYKDFIDHQKNYLSLKKGFRQDIRSTIHRQNWHLASDHGVFYQAKIPYLYFGVGTHRNYHTPKDNYQNVNLPLFLANTQAIYQQVIFIDKNII